jgi:predicted enzyme related to lactoylglutathione lyase
VPSVDSHPHGAPCWFELATTDQNAANTFYTSTLGWTLLEFPLPDGSKYSMFQLNGRDTGAAYTMMPEVKAQGVPPHWMVYFAVANVDDAVRRLQELGGSVKQPAFDVMEHGRMAVCADPEGVVFSLWQPKQHIGVKVFGDDNSVCWVELATRDMARAKEFYSQLLGWQTQQSQTTDMAYTEFMVPGQKQTGGMLQMDAQWEGIPAYWGIYFKVARADEWVEKAKQHGAKVCHGPFNAPQVGRIAIMSDPQGAMFSIIELKAM